MAPEIHLIGTVHIDVDGSRRLRKALDQINPDVVAYENDEEGTGDFEILGRALKMPRGVDLMIDNLALQFGAVNRETCKLFLESAGFEYFVSRDFCKERGIKLVLGDNAIGDVSHMAPEFSNILTLSPPQFHDIVRNAYSKPDLSGNLPVDLKLEIRDVDTERVLRGLSGRVAYIGGVGHFYGDYSPNLYERLKDLNPKRMKLNEFD